MTLVLDRLTGGGPGTHAIVIGVSSYPYLDAAPENLSPMVSGLKSLISPAVSARTFANWLASEYSNRRAPIATIDLLVSDADKAPFELEGQIFDELDAPDLDAVTASVIRWMTRGNADPDGILIFFFCGHGLTAGLKNALLLQDCGRVPERPMRGAFDPALLQAAMKTCKASKQAYFLDACRGGNRKLFAAHTEPLDPLAPIDEYQNPASRQAVFYSTLHGALAYGRQDGQPSLFTSALIEALGGVAANDREMDWHVNTSDLQSALDHLTSDLADPRHGGVQSPAQGSGAGFVLHELAGPPTVPFYICSDWEGGAEPPSEVTSLSVTSGNGQPINWASPWTMQTSVWSWAPERFKGRLSAGAQYEATVRMEDGATRNLRWYMMPPYKRLELL